MNLEATPSRSAGWIPHRWLLRAGEVREAVVRLAPLKVAVALKWCSARRVEATRSMLRPTGGHPKRAAAQYWTGNSSNTLASTSLTPARDDLWRPAAEEPAVLLVNYEADWNRSTVTRTGQVPVSPLTSQDPVDAAGARR